MLYLVKFFYQTFLLPPGCIILLLAAASFWQYKKKDPKCTKLFVIITAILYLISTPMVCDSLIWSLEKKYQPPSELNGDVIIMLGGGAFADTPNVNGKGHLSSIAANRLLTCVQLYYKLDVPIIISGGQIPGHTTSEGEIAMNILLSLGVPEEKIIVENRSLNTTQNAFYTKELLDKHGFNKPILVTSAFHMKRAVKQFEKNEVNVIPYPTDYQTNSIRKITFMDFVPSAEALQKFYFSVKEYVGIVASRWY
ncbi:MAG TPA: YdcF family protein [Hungateiclostridium thermocellum]|jgi:uncharacterized SAM-binding protein YcdF (DUF218 family)|uniref:DUF218 domain-containing protein n=2 Tax=Acetivibrio thermocellus TaxID=1515 RepID=A3DHT6_ACET2|nr:YdcF family protein [Acetivibrio thermocellus]ABN53515.1 protein of unknown function DUF218 [Acetivibrio thermocellus ATCC 27405]ADU75964.1 protein of unknown function DUF218 [Acetivibrio thermocellus DSM 1313]ALX09999.1 protein of unknown function DUF218 [Acetivibrio thermocellus AD2]ANV77773.1 protein of unknown function DUF218 [Acetivibrio thermocellus DSM 2360]EIC03804.1 protein of unknown function DUF218 [Acetivibrio thermocellus YS]